MTRSHHHKQSGLTLLELLISMTVGMMLITGIIQLMANNKQHYLFQSELARMQENGRYALSVLRQELQMAGASGCSASSQVNNLLDTDPTSGYSDTLYNLSQPVGGWEYIEAGFETAPGDAFTLTDVLSGAVNNWDNGSAASSALDTSLNNKVYKSSDVLVVKRAEPALDLTNTTAFTFPTTTTSFSVSENVDDGQIVVISDCSGADLFRNCAATTPNQVARSNCTGTPNNDTGLPLGHSYEVLAANEDATISPVSINSYYVGSGQDNTPTLYRKNFSKGAPLNAEPLVEGIESMQILYGVDTSGDSVPNQYVTAAGLGAVLGTDTYADHVVTVRISLLLRSVEEIEEVVNSDSLLMAEATINSGADRYLRKAVSTTVQLRNGGA